MTREELVKRLADVNKWSDSSHDDSERFHVLEDKLARSVLNAIADGSVWDSKDAARMMADQMAAPNTRWFA